MRRRYFTWIVLAILIAFPLGADIFYSGFYVSLLTRIFIYAIIVVGFDLLAGYTGMISYWSCPVFRHRGLPDRNDSQALDPLVLAAVCSHDRCQRLDCLYRWVFIYPHPGDLFRLSDLCLFPVLLCNREQLELHRRIQRPFRRPQTLHFSWIESFRGKFLLLFCPRLSGRGLFTCPAHHVECVWKGHGGDSRE